jgi:hypothetical protein
MSVMGQKQKCPGSHGTSIYPQEQISSACPGMSVWCRPNPDIAASFDHVVGDCEHFIWNDKAKRPGGLAVDDEIKFGWLLDRQIAGLRPT